jgi:glycosyltransferase involved in cell wall biosynthesis
MAAEALAGRGWDVSVVAWSDSLEHDDSAYGFRVARIPRSEPWPLRMAHTLFSIARFGMSSDIIFSVGLALESAMANILLRKPLVMKIVGDAAWERATRWGWTGESFEAFQAGKRSAGVRLLKHLRNWPVRHSDRVITPSGNLAGCVRRWGADAGKVVVIPNGVEVPGAGDIHKFLPTSNPLSTPVKIAAVGRLVPWKRVDRLLEAISRMEGVGLVVVGDGPERGRLEEQVKELKIADRVHFTGAASREEALGWMASCDMLAICSNYEGLPHVALEATSLGLPVVATAVGGVPEIVQDGWNGRLAPVDDKEAFFAALASVAGSLPERRRLSAGAKETARLVSFPSMVERTEAVLRSASAAPGRRSGGSR